PDRRAGTRLRGLDAARARVPDRAGRHERLGRPAPAPVHRPGPGRETLAVPVRRLLQRPGPHHRRPPARGARARGRGRADARGRPAGLDHHLGGSDPGAGQRPDRRPGHPPRAARELGDLSRDRALPGRRGGGVLMTASKDESMTSETTPETTPETVPAAGDEASAAAEIASETDAAR